ncbi:vesicle-associated membrane 3 [Brachionus plicatilis]|uniref:Vesicle-associated membrane 3 n=1 Tax=Brachionus plicatilis TaxID=10195 RepID=A0A3M7SMF4_BRAPC|nr:vesicle-associated membrane 3 [Brachionus plicatilis]
MKNPSFNQETQQNKHETEIDQTDKKIDNTQKEIDEIKDIMKDNIDKMIYRGVNLTDLKDSCDHLEAQAAQFQVVSRKIRRKMYFKKNESKDY